MEIVFSFISKYFLEPLVILGFGIVSKVALKYFSNDRWEVIKENVLIAMLWAEDTFGMGHGQEKWSKAWQKIIVLLKEKGIVLKDKEIQTVTTMMKANVPVINSITYSSVPEAIREVRPLPGRTPEMIALLDLLHKKHTPPIPVKKKTQKNKDLSH